MLQGQLDYFADHTCLFYCKNDWATFTLKCRQARDHSSVTFVTFVSEAAMPTICVLTQVRIHVPPLQSEPSQAPALPQTPENKCTARVTRVSGPSRGHGHFLFENWLYSRVRTIWVVSLLPSRLTEI